MTAGELHSGAGLRVMACVRLRDRNVDYADRQTLVRNGQGQKHRVTRFAPSLPEPLERRVEKGPGPSRTGSKAN